MPPQGLPANLPYFSSTYLRKIRASSSIWTITNGTEVTNGDRLQLSAVLAPGGFSVGSQYYVVNFNAGASTFELSLTSGGPAITASTVGTASASLIKMGGASIDLWDTIDDYNNNSSGLPSGLVADWSVDNQCGGVETAAGDDNIWKDVTTTGDGVTASTCTATSTHCSYQDKISGLSWSKAETNKDWGKALTYCESLSHNGKTDWRLPTQKELMNASEHGIRSTQSANYISSFALQFWSATSTSISTKSAWNVNLANGVTDQNTKVNSIGAVCVRP